MIFYTKNPPLPILQLKGSNFYVFLLLRMGLRAIMVHGLRPIWALFLV